jgi:glycosyltransferase involved in cell wall biosynthesis
MKIAFIGQKGIPAIFGGVEYHVQELAQRLIKRGHEVDVYVRSWYTAQHLKNHKGIRLIHTPTIRTKHLDAFLHSFSSSLHALFQKYDIVHFHALGPTVFCWLPKLAGKRIVATIHGLDWKRGKWGGVAKAFLKYTERTALYIPDRTIVVSKEQQVYFEAKYGKKAVYIPNGVNMPAARPAPAVIKKKYGLHGRDYLLWMGRITPEKRVDWMIKAYKELKPECKLVIAGGSSATDEYVRKCKKCAAENKKIIFTGFVRGQEKEELLSNALLFVSPSYLEGFPIAVLEAMSYRRVCLISDIEPHRELIGHGIDGFLFASDDLMDFVKKLQKLLSKGTDLGNIGEKALIKVKKNHSWDDIAEKTELVYYSVKQCK